MQKTDSQAKSKMKLYADATRNAATSPIKLGDTVLVANDAKGKLSPPFDPRPLIIVEKKGSMLTAADHDKTVTRNSSHFKLLPGCLFVPNGCLFVPNSLTSSQLAC